MPIRLSLVLAGLLAGSGLSPRAQAQGVYADVRAARDLTQEGASALEQRLADNPGDEAARVQLIIYYFGRRDSDARKRKVGHILWLVRNRPESEALSAGYGQINHVLNAGVHSEALTAWSQHLENMPDNLKVLRNAAKFLMFSDRQRAIKLLERARQIDGANPLWARELGQLHRLDMGGGLRELDEAAAARALTQYERAYDLLGAGRGDSLLRYLAETALGAGQTPKARFYADSMLSDDRRGWNRGNRIHHGHMTLGRIALAEGNLEEAKYRLLKAGETPGSPQLNSFGPQMDLAKALLERGEVDVVVRYLELCAEFWNTDRAMAELAQWTALAKAGEIPDFR